MFHHNNEGHDNFNSKINGKNISNVNKENINKIDNNVKYKRMLWIRCRLLKNNNFFVPPRMESILCNSVLCEFGYTTLQYLHNESTIQYDSDVNFGDDEKKHGNLGSGNTGLGFRK